MDKKEKYLKYKSKYIKLKKQIQTSGGFNFKKINNKEDIKKIISFTDNKFYTYPGTDYYFYYLDNDIIGHVFIQKPNNDIHIVLKEPMHNRHYIWDVEIFEKYRGQGYGYKMLSEILDNSKEYFLIVQKDNIPAIKLYEKLGFRYYKQQASSMFYVRSKKID